MPNKQKTRKRSRSKNFVALPVEGSLALSTLANGSVIKANIMTGIVTEDLFVISADLEVTVDALTAGEGDPSSWGVSHSDYTATEIEEHQDVTLLGRGSKIEQERLRRLIRNGGMLHEDSLNATELVVKGTPKRIKVRFMIQEGFALEIWLRNRSGAAFTTGASLKWFGTVYGKWVT